MLFQVHLTNIENGLLTMTKPTVQMCKIHVGQVLEKYYQLKVLFALSTKRKLSSSFNVWGQLGIEQSQPTKLVAEKLATAEK